MHFNNYFRPTKGYFWHWEDDVSVIAVPGGSTIAYYQQAMDILKAIAFQGLPQFGPFLLAMAALSPSKEILLGEMKLCIGNALRDDALQSDWQLLEKVFTFLGILSNIPEKHKQGPYKIQLFQVLFENVHNQVGSSNAKLLLHDMEEHPNSYAGMHGDQVAVVNIFRIDFKIMELLYQQFPNEHAVLQKMAGLPKIEEAVLQLEPEMEPEKVTPDFVQELIDNPKTFHVGALVKRIWSGLNIPFHSQLPSDQPLGGVSDLTTKGDFDKLLISEFANDDLVFMSRLANNEALYIRREIPPAKNNRNRIILIDVSIKNWGTPRTIAYAIMVAIAKHPKSDFSCMAFAVGFDIYPIGFDTVDEVLDGLQILEGSIDPVQGLLQFVKAYGQNDHIEVVFMTTTETMQLPAMQKVLYEHAALFNYWIYTGIDGQVSLFKRQQNSKKHVQDFVLPLDSLWQKTKQETGNPPKKETDPSAALCPVLFRCALKPSQIMVAADGEVYAIDSERQLMRASPQSVSFSRGWEMLYENLPSHINKFAIGKMDDGSLMLLMFNLHNREITLLHLQTGTKQILKFPDWRASRFPDFIFSEERFYYFEGNKYTVIDPVAGTIAVNMNYMETEHLALCQRYDERITKSRKMAVYYPGILKNIVKVFINQNNNLVFNSHELHLKIGKQIWLGTKGEPLQRIVGAEPNSHKTEFFFPDGSAIQINRSGMIRFKSINDDIPVFFIPAVIDYPLAIGIEREFAGNEFFLPEQPDIRLNNDFLNKFWQTLTGRFIEQILNHHYMNNVTGHGTAY